MERITLSLAILFLCINQIHSQSCPLTQRVGKVQKSFKSCKNLVEQGATLAWTHTMPSNILEVVFTGTAPSPSGWVGWGINPGSSPQMFGSDAFVAFKSSNGSSMLETYKLEPSSIGSLTPTAISLNVLNKSVEISGSSMKMYIMIQLQNNKTTLNHIWNKGSGMKDLTPLPHAQSDVRSNGRFDIASGTSSATVVPHQKLKNRHGIINAVGWGLLLPVGVMSARYLRSFESADPAWFYIHAFCQSSGYILGVVGWATGLKLGTYTSVALDKHRNLGISIFVFATLQVLSLLLRPKKDHKIRRYWNVYHHTIGYATIAMIIVNIFEGFDILQPDKKWKHAYIGVISALGGISLIMEVITWIIYFHKKSRSSPEMIKGGGNGINHNGLYNGTRNSA